MKRVGVVTAVMFAGASLTPCFAGHDAAGAAVRTARQIEVPAAKERLVDQIMAEAEQRAGQEWDTASKENLKRGLLGKPFAELAQAARGDQALEVLMGPPCLRAAPWTRARGRASRATATGPSPRGLPMASP